MSGATRALRIEDEVARVAIEALASEPGSILVFLPGQGEIARVAAMLAERVKDPAVDIAPLFGAMDARAQDLAVAPAAPGRRKIVLATSIAETSLTIEGVRVVIDSGLMRVPRFEPDIGLTRLETVRVSRANADQRRGRAGRVEPGVCYRLWEEAANGGLLPFAPPEILSADLSELRPRSRRLGRRRSRRAEIPRSAAARGVLGGARAADDARRSRRRRAHHRRGPRDLAPRAAAAPRAHACRRRARGRRAPRRRDRRRAHRARARRRRRRSDAAAAKFPPRPLAARARTRGGSRAIWKAARFRWSRRGAAETRRLAGAWLAAAFPERIAMARGKPGEFLMANGRAAALEPHEALARRKLSRDRRNRRARRRRRASSPPRR